ncbi:MAG: FtsW/RodA/SpoVE family cell cycle protein, partial [Candidatus Omnitrophota bacterium]
MNRDAIALLIISLAICCVGLVSIYSSSGLDNRDLLSRQLLWMGLGLICFLVMYFLSYRQLWDFVWFLYIVAILFLLLVMVLGSVRMGAQRWIKIGWLNFQPSELVKLTTVLVLARYYAQAFNSRSFIKDIVLPFMIIGIPVLLIMEQPDLGSAIMVLLITIAMIF